MLKICLKSFFIHAHLHYVCSIPAKYLRDTMKAQGGVDFKKYAILTILNVCID